jgi:hypothetical protein
MGISPHAHPSSTHILFLLNISVKWFQSGVSPPVPRGSLYVSYVVAPQERTSGEYRVARAEVPASSGTLSRPLTPSRHLDFGAVPTAPRYFGFRPHP